MLLVGVPLTVALVCGLFGGMVTSLVTPKKFRKEKDNFSLVCQTNTIAGDIPIYKFRSRKTGLQVIIAKVEGPVVEGFFTIATEAQDDDGLPHALEHLVFLGSDEYPYKGVLDLLANRCLAEGTNAWTGTDHTAYTIVTAGKEGFLNLLPIYMDHLLYPTLTDAGFVTEVYHITGEGEDAGVVYSEMLARENKGSQLTYQKLTQILYPEPSGYRYETGGILANLRNSTNNEKVRNYHRKMYTPENLHLIITGQVEPKEVFQALRSIEHKIVAEGDREEVVRPWKKDPPPFEVSQDVEVVYPGDTEETGIVRVAWRGPSIITEMDEFQSMEVLLNYLTDTSVSPLPRVFVEVDDPLASYIYGYEQEFSTSSSIITFGGVPLDHINEVKPLLMETLEKISSGAIPIDLEVMRNLLSNLILEEESHLETAPHDTLAEKIILDVLYGHDCESMDKVINSISWYEHLLTEPASYWMNLVKKYFISTPVAVVRGVPSIAKAIELQDMEEERVAQRISEVGLKGLEEWQNEVEEAERINDIPPPDYLLESVPVPTTKSINFHSLRVYTNIKNHQSGIISHSEDNLFDLSTLPLKMQLDDIKSNFVQIVAILDTQSLTQTGRLYLPLLMELLLESPLQNGGTRIDYEEVIKDLNADTLKAETMSGVRMSSSSFKFGKYFNNIGLNFKVELAKYRKGIEWLHLILFHVIFDQERVDVKVNKLLNSFGDKKMEADAMLKVMYNDVVFANDTNLNKANALRQEKFLEEVLLTLETNPNKILDELSYVYRNITDIDSITIHMATNLEALSQVSDITKPWFSFIPVGQKGTHLNLAIMNDWETRVPFDTTNNVTGYVAGIGSAESSYLLQTSPAITSYSDADLPILLIAISYLTQMEGPMWKQIRGRGLAYNFLITMEPDRGMLTLKLARASQLSEAYQEALSIINAHLNDTIWNRLLFESARSSLVYEIIEREGEISDVIQQSLYSYYRKVPHDYNRAFLQALDRVKLEDLHRIAVKFFKPLVNPHESRTFVVCPVSKVEEIKLELSQFGHNVEVIDSLENSRFSEL